MKKSVHDYTEFGKQVKIAMLSMGMTSRQLAKALGYKESTLCDILKGRNRSYGRQVEITEMLQVLEKEYIQSKNVE